MKLKPDVADHLYTVLAQTLEMPDADYRRWSFVYAVTELRVSSYRIDSSLGLDAHLTIGSSVIVVCAPHQLTPERERLTQLANRMIAEIVHPKRAKVVRPIRIDQAKPSVQIAVIQVPSLEDTSQHLQ